MLKHTLTLLVASLLTTQAHAFSVYGIGATRCNDYLFVYNDRDERRLGGYVDWFQGYFSGIDATLDGNFGKGVVNEPGVIRQWLYDFCRTNGETTIVEAATSLYDEMTREPLQEENPPPTPPAGGSQPPAR